MSKNKLLFILLLSLFIPSIIFADCTEEEIDNFREIEEQYNVTYDFDTTSKTYMLNFENPDPQTYGYKVQQKKSDTNYTTMDLLYKEAKTFTLSEISPGKYTIEIYGKTNSCTEKLKTIELELPKYNKYSEDPLCEGLEEFVLCQPTYDKDIDYDTFVSRVNTYKKNKEEKSVQEEEPKPTKEENKIVSYIEDNLLQIIVIAVFIVMVVITIILTVKSIRKSRRLE